jgi:hypothetical protein
MQLNDAMRSVLQKGPCQMQLNDAMRSVLQAGIVPDAV